jgi:hypothetical protein
LRAKHDVYVVVTDTDHGRNHGTRRSLRKIWGTEEDKAAAPEKAKSPPFKKDQALKKTIKAFPGVK